MEQLMQEMSKKIKGELQRICHHHHSPKNTVTQAMKEALCKN